MELPWHGHGNAMADLVRICQIWSDLVRCCPDLSLLVPGTMYLVPGTRYLVPGTSLVAPTCSVDCRFFKNALFQNFKHVNSQIGPDLSDLVRFVSKDNIPPKLRYDIASPYCGSEHRDTHHHEFGYRGIQVAPELPAHRLFSYEYC